MALSKESNHRKPAWYWSNTKGNLIHMNYNFSRKPSNKRYKDKIILYMFLQSVINQHIAHLHSVNHQKTDNYHSLQNSPIIHLWGIKHEKLNK